MCTVHVPEHTGIDLPDNVTGNLLELPRDDDHHYDQSDICSASQAWA